MNGNRPPLRDQADFYRRRADHYRKAHDRLVSINNAKQLQPELTLRRRWAYLALVVIGSFFVVAFSRWVWQNTGASDFYVGFLTGITLAAWWELVEREMLRRHADPDGEFFPYLED